MSVLRRLLWAVALSGFVFTASQNSELHSIYFAAPPTGVHHPTDYILTIDGATVPIVNVVAGPQSLSVIVLVDVSDSMRRLDVKDIARRVAGTVRPEDAIRLGTFANKTLLSTTQIVDSRSATIAANEVIQTGGISPLWDALYDVAAMFGRASGLRAVVVFTDAMATGNEHAFQEVLERLTGAGITVNLVGQADSALWVVSNVRFTTRNDRVRALVELTGGLYSELQKRTETPSEHIVAALGELRKRHRLDFKPPVRDGALHDVGVTANGTPIPVPRRLRF